METFFDFCQSGDDESCWKVYMGMKFHTNEAIVMRLSDGVMVRTRSIHRQERDVTMEM